MDNLEVFDNSIDDEILKDTEKELINALLSELNVLSSDRESIISFSSDYSIIEKIIADATVRVIDAYEAYIKYCRENMEM